MQGLIGIFLVDIKSKLVNSILDEAMRDKDVGDGVLILGRDKKRGDGEERRSGALAFVGDADDARAPCGGDAAAATAAAAAAAATIASGGGGVGLVVVGHGAHAVGTHFLCWFRG